jgi:dipeptidyl aminopeptidase/acylaminoacyl peptidase
MLKFLFLALFLFGCSTPTKPNFTAELGYGLTPYVAEDYSVIQYDSDPPSEKTYSQCVQNFLQMYYKFYSLSYKSDGLNIKAIVGLPPNFDSNVKHPLLVFNRGGNRNFGFMTACDLFLLRDFENTIPSAIVIASQLRGSHGSEGSDEYGGKDVDDIINLIKWSEAVSFIDSQRRYIGGWSRGGMMTYLVLKKKIPFKAAFVIAGSSDLFILKKQRPEMNTLFQELIPDYDSNQKNLLQDRSARYWANKFETPLLIVHGTSDWRAPFEDANRMDAILTKLKKPHQFVVYPNEGHDLEKSYEKMLQEIRLWFGKWK